MAAMERVSQSQLAIFAVIFFVSCVMSELAIGTFSKPLVGSLTHRRHKTRQEHTFRSLGHRRQRLEVLK